MANNPNMPPLRLDRSLLPAAALLVLVFGLFELTWLDLWIQDRFFDFSAGTWMIDRNEPVARALFYSGPKVLLVGLSLALIASLVRPPRSFRRCDLGVALLTLGSVPVLVGLGKDTTNVFCPWDITRYGGDAAYVRVLERFGEDERPARRGRGFPAGHASGGFALVGLAGLARTRRGQVAAIALAAAAGGAMGWYQIAKGAHYLSHTLVTALLAWILFLINRRLLRARLPEDSATLHVPIP